MKPVKAIDRVFKAQKKIRRERRQRMAYKKGGGK